MANTPPAAPTSSTGKGFVFTGAPAASGAAPAGSSLFGSGGAPSSLFGTGGSSLFGAKPAGSSLFGEAPAASSLFGAVKPSTSAAEPEEKGLEENPDGTAVEEEVDVHFEPKIRLHEVEVTTGEDDEDTLFTCRAKLFRMDHDAREWKERGVGDIKFLKHKTNGKIRILMRREKTLKICANHYVTPIMRLSSNCGNDRSWVWKAHDFSEMGDANWTLKEETLAIRFTTVEITQNFRAAFERCVAEVAATAHIEVPPRAAPSSPAHAASTATTTTTTVSPKH
eukprot:gnl/Spiro4/28200_TR13951_c0_g1_i1.p1 gnl/Spiro4/28200_TR13951_c0_g1~~gnl/Spiro4/28200_TR13951_c0_g1_i1.p1  ORF type:complete len:294 (-),score=82.78 gnl/Spiro4/28200_TR13951_c0_g1_i1:168-1010(-)